MADGSLIFDTKIDDSGFKKGLSALGKISSNVLSGTTKAIKLTTAALGAMSLASIKVGSDFQASMSNVTALMGATNQEAQLLKDTAMELGRITSFSASEAADGMSYLAMAGFNANEVVDAMPGLLNAAAAGQSDLGATADIVSNILSGFGMTADQTGKVADTLTKAFTSSNTSLESLGETMKYVAPVANAAGWALEETASAAGVLGDAGIQGGEAGTALRGIILRLIDPPKQAAAALDQLGISAIDAGTGKLKPLAQIISEVDEATRDMEEAQRAQIAAQIAGTSASGAFLALLDAGGDTLSNFTEELLNSAGVAERIANEQLDNLQGDLQLLGSVLETLGIVAYETFDGSLREAVQGISLEVGHIVDALKNSGMEGFIEEIGKSFGRISTQIAKHIPKAVESVKLLLDSMLNTFTENSPDIAEGISAGIVGLIDILISTYPTFLNIGMQTIAHIVQGIAESIPTLINTAMASMSSLKEGLMISLPMMIESGADIIAGIINGIADNSTELLEGGLEIIIAVADGIIENLPTIVDAGINLIGSLVEGIMNSLPTLIAEVPRIINDFADEFHRSIPKIFMLGLEIIWNIITGIIEAIPTLIENVPQIILAIVNVISMYNWLQIGSNVVTWIKDGLLSMVESIASGAKLMASNVVEGIKGVFSQGPSIGRKLIELLKGGVDGIKDILIDTASEVATKAIEGIADIWSTAKTIGGDLVKGLWNGINNKVDWILDKIKGFGTAVMNGMKSIFGIKSPSREMRDEVGVWLPAGIGEGIEDGTGDLLDTVDKEMSEVSDKYVDTAKSLSEDLNKALNTVDEDFLDVLIDKFDMLADKILETIEQLKEIPDIDWNKLQGLDVGGLLGKLSKAVDKDSFSLARHYQVTQNTKTNDSKDARKVGDIIQNITIERPERTPIENAREIEKAGRDLLYEI